MKIDDNYTIHIAPMNVILRYTGAPYTRKIKGEDQLVTPTDEWYLGSVRQALCKYVDLCLSDSAAETESVLDLINKIDELKSKINAVS